MKRLFKELLKAVIIVEGINIADWTINYFTILSMTLIAVASFIHLYKKRKTHKNNLTN